MEIHQTDDSMKIYCLSKDATVNQSTQLKVKKVFVLIIIGEVIALFYVASCKYANSCFTVDDPSERNKKKLK